MLQARSVQRNQNPRDANEIVSKFSSKHFLSSSCVTQFQFPPYFPISRACSRVWNGKKNHHHLRRGNQMVHWIDLIKENIICYLHTFSVFKLKESRGKTIFLEIGSWEEAFLVRRIFPSPPLSVFKTSILRLKKWKAIKARWERWKIWHPLCKISKSPSEREDKLWNCCIAF